MRPLIPIVFAGACAIAMLGMASVRADQDAPDSTWQPGVPAKDVKGVRTGYQIPGCAHYNLDGARIRQVCSVRSPRNPEFWRNHERHMGGGVPPTN